MNESESIHHAAALATAAAVMWQSKQISAGSPRGMRPTWPTSTRIDLQAMTDPQALASNAELRRLLERAIQRLPEQFRTAFVLREVEGLSVEETAEYLGIPSATVKTRDHRARNLLRSYLTENIDATIPQTFPFLGVRCDELVERVLQRLKM